MSKSLHQKVYTLQTKNFGLKYFEQSIFGQKNFGRIFTLFWTKS